MSTTTETTQYLTAEDVKALQKADKVVFRIYNGVATIEPSLDGGYDDNHRIYTPTEQRLYAKADYGLDRIRVIEISGSVNGIGANAAFAWFPSAKYDDRWYTLSSMLRLNDALSLHFRADGFSNEITRTAGLHADAAYLHITHRAAKRPLVFLLDVSVSLDNTARMVRSL